MHIKKNTFILKVLKEPYVGGGAQNVTYWSVTIRFFLRLPYEAKESQFKTSPNKRIQSSYNNVCLFKLETYIRMNE